MANIYFGGSRHSQNINPSQIAQVVGAVVAAGSSVHVGCQLGADQAVVSLFQDLQNSRFSSSLHVFSVTPSLFSLPVTHRHISKAYHLGASVTFSAGGTSAPTKARYLLRSIAAFQGCSAAVFFNPGSGSLAVAREFIAHFLKRGVHPCNGIPLFAFSQAAPAPVPSVSGSWVASSFAGFSCWQWVAPVQISLF